MPPSFPLSWPQWVKRTRTRRQSNFGRHVGGKRALLDLGASLRRLEDELSRLGAKHAVVSSDLGVHRADGWPMSNQALPSDPGVAVYFTLKGEHHCMPCDRWNRLPDNIAAIAAHIDAVRKIERYGVSDIAAALSSFRAALPAADGSDWKSIFPQVETIAELTRRYRTLAIEAHPDQGGNEVQMARLSRAYKRAQKELPQ